MGVEVGVEVGWRQGGGVMVRGGGGGMELG